MKVSLFHFLVIIFAFTIIQSTVYTGASRLKITIRNQEDENCTRDGDIIICPCNVTVNGTFYPCWLPLSNATAPACFECPLGTYSSNESTPNCTNSCPSGLCIPPFRCNLCSPGYFANVTGSSACIQCAPGYAAPKPGSWNCSGCTAGYVSSHDRTECLKCPGGSFSNGNANSMCPLCPEGEYSKEGATQCSQCGTGTFNEIPGQSSCFPCGQGFYGPGTGQTSREACIVCPAGSYCPEQTTPFPSLCPRNYFCEQGAFLPTACPSFHLAKPGQAACTPSMGLYLLVFGCAGLVLVAAVVVWRWRVTRQRRQQTQIKQTEIERLIPKPIDGPVYSGL